MNDWSEMFEKQNDEIEKFEENEQNTAETQKLLKKKFNKLKHKALYIDAEYEETCEIFSFAQSEFISRMFRYCSDKKIHPPFSEGSGNQKKDESKKDTSDELKDLYREIVKATHPDKTKNLPENEIQERKELYLEAVRGKQEGNYWGIFKAALELDVPIKKLSFSYLDELEATINNLEQKMSKMKNDLMYKWYYLNEASQQNIFEQLTKNQEKYE
jgi:hypothetical protein